MGKAPTGWGRTYDNGLEKRMGEGRGGGVVGKKSCTSCITLTRFFPSNRDGKGLLGGMLTEKNVSKGGYIMWFGERRGEVGLWREGIGEKGEIRFGG